MVHGQSIKLGSGGHQFIVVPHEGRIRAYGCYRSQVVDAHLTPAEAREAARTMVAIADDLDPAGAQKASA